MANLLGQIQTQIIRMYSQLFLTPECLADKMLCVSFMYVCSTSMKSLSLLASKKVHELLDFQAHASTKQKKITTKD